MTTLEQFCDNCGSANPLTARFCQNCAAPLDKGVPHDKSGGLQPATNTTGTLPGQTLLVSRYQLESRIGQGGMGAVYKAADTRFNNRAIAIKEMSKAGLSSVQRQEAEAAFEHEARLLADLLHPNLPRIYDHFTENERSYLVMDFIDGKTIEEDLEQAGGGPLPVDQVINWAEQLCDVLSYLHNRQPAIIFRDLKPANVMVDDSGHVFLIDFGIARFFKPGKLHDTIALGSPGYAAPEQYGKSQSTPRSDLYSLGALLHHLLTGLDPSEQPFFFRPASQVNPAVSPGLELLLAQMLQMDPDHRPASAQEVLEALRLIKQGADIGTSTLHISAKNTSVPLTMGTNYLLKEAHTLYTQRRLDEAVKVYDQALQIDRTNSLGWQGRGLTQGLRAKHQEALASFERALQLDPTLITSWNGKGTALSALQRPREALTAFERALQLEPKNAAAWNGKGAVLSTLGQSDQALSAFDEALTIDPRLAQAWNNKGLVLIQQQRQQEALNAFERALTYDPTIATSWSGKGNALHYLGNLQDALDAYEKASSYNRALVPAWNGKGSVLYDLGRNNEALQAFQEAVNLDKKYAPAYYGMGKVLYSQHKLKTALSMFDRAIAYDPKFAKAWNGRGNVLDEQGERIGALNSYEQALRNDPRHAPAWNGKAGVLRQLERYTEALNAYDYALKLNPNFPQAWNGRGNT
ncbi:MAG TPA: tetratricopeptide repeat protein, partial [Ktedonobacteraceae bacterium]|nr:tetratricopeptide repeat protein [Ktedonobacteraceae bacterium]